MFTIKDASQGAVFASVRDERDRQDEMWGVQIHDPAYWLAIMGKQTGQLGDAVLKYKWAAVAAKDMQEQLMYEEAAQVAAVAVALMEAILNEQLSDEVTSVRPEPRKLARLLNRGHESVNYDKDAPTSNGDRAPVAPPYSGQTRTRAYEDGL